MHRPVQNTHAFHSRLLDPIVPAFADEVRKVRLNAPGIPFISNVTGRWITAADATDPDYWARHANHTARFHDALQTLWQTEDPILLEAGPGRTLSVLAQQHPSRPATTSSTAIASLRHHYESQPDEEVLLTGAGRLWLCGLKIRWENLHGEKSRRKISLPTYPFERQNPLAGSGPCCDTGACGISGDSQESESMRMVLRALLEANAGEAGWHPRVVRTTGRKARMALFPRRVRSGFRTRRAIPCGRARGRHGSRWQGIQDGRYAQVHRRAGYGGALRAAFGNRSPPAI